jgi:hypothetical protein
VFERPLYSGSLAYLPRDVTIMIMSTGAHDGASRLSYTLPTQSRTRDAGFSNLLCLFNRVQHCKEVRLLERTSQS